MCKTIHLSLCTWSILVKNSADGSMIFFQNRQNLHEMSKKVREKSRECHNHKPQPPTPQDEEETDKSKQAQTEQTYEKH